MIRATVLVCIAFVSMGCGGAPVANPFTEEIIVWPEPPEIRRIAYVGEFSDSSALGFEPVADGLLFLGMDVVLDVVCLSIWTYSLPTSERLT